MTSWSPWGRCSATCGDGMKTRIRQIIKQPEYDGKPCGNTVERQNCNLRPCAGIKNISLYFIAIDYYILWLA